MSLAGYLAYSSAIIAVAALPAAAQDDSAADSTPFRRGQWAVQFAAPGGLGAGFVGVGALRFRDAARAWLLDVRANVSHAEVVISDTAGRRVFVDSRAVADLRIGSRRYHQIATSTVGFHTFGVLAGFSHLASASGSEDDGWKGGAFAEVGGAYNVTEHLGLGATAEANVTYERSSIRLTSGEKRAVWRIAASAVAFTIVATLYF